MHNKGYPQAAVASARVNGASFSCAVSWVCMLELEETCWGPGGVREDDRLCWTLYSGFTSTRCLPEDGSGADLELNLRGGA